MLSLDVSRHCILPWKPLLTLGTLKRLPIRGGVLDLVSCQFVPAGVGVFTLGATENFVFLIWLKMLPPIMLAETVLPPVHLATFSTVEHGLTWLCFNMLCSYVLPQDIAPSIRFITFFARIQQAFSLFWLSCWLHFCSLFHNIAIIRTRTWQDGDGAWFINLHFLFGVIFLCRRIVRYNSLGQSKQSFGGFIFFVTSSLNLFWFIFSLGFFSIWVLRPDMSLELPQLWKSFWAKFTNSFFLSMDVLDMLSNISFLFKLFLTQVALCFLFCVRMYLEHMMKT